MRWWSCGNIWTFCSFTETQKWMTRIKTSSVFLSIIKTICKNWSPQLYFFHFHISFKMYSWNQMFTYSIKTTFPIKSLLGFPKLFLYTKRLSNETHIYLKIYLLFFKVVRLYLFFLVPYLGVFSKTKNSSCSF